jgi:hypothetical protein
MITLSSDASVVASPPPSRGDEKLPPPHAAAASAMTDAKKRKRRRGRDGVMGMEGAAAVSTSKALQGVPVPPQSLFVLIVCRLSRPYRPRQLQVASIGPSSRGAAS